MTSELRLVCHRCGHQMVDIDPWDGSYSPPWWQPVGMRFDCYHCDMRYDYAHVAGEFPEIPDTIDQFIVEEPEKR